MRLRQNTDHAVAITEISESTKHMLNIMADRVETVTPWLAKIQLFLDVYSVKEIDRYAISLSISVYGGENYR
jgi:hypothetical protein